MPLQLPINRPLPDDLLRAIGRLAVEWALLENSMEQLLWNLLFVTQFANEGRAITTHIPFRTRIDIVLSYARERIDYPELIAELEKLLREIDRKRGERNAYIHAEWSYYPGAPHMMADTFAAHGELKFRTRNVTPADVEKVADDVIALNDKLNELSREVFNAVLNT